MKKILQSALSLMVAACIFVPASASAYTYATEVLWAPGDFSQVPANVDLAARTDPNNALGVDNDLFLSLGFGSRTQDGPVGMAVFSFGTLFTEAAIVFEQTNSPGNPTGGGDHYESASVYGSFDAEWVAGSTAHSVFGSGLWDFFGAIDNFTEPNVINIAGGGVYKYLAIIDTTAGRFPQSSSFDGFDIDAVGVKPIPEPATMLLFGAGLAGLAGVARRRKEA